MTSVTFFPEDTKGNSKAAREYKKIFLIENENKIILSKDDYDAIPDMVESVRHTISISEIPDLLNGGESELSCYHTDEETGVLLKCRSDYIHRDLGLSVNFKTSRSIKSHELRSSAAEYGYHIQTAFYLHILGAKLKRDVGEIHVIIETNERHGVIVRFFEDAPLERGREKFLPILREIAAAEKSGIWNASRPMDIPGWAYTK